MRDFSKYYLDIKNNYNAAIAEAVRDLYSLFDDGIYKWLSSLWDKDEGGFYYSRSARDNEGFFPDIESTAQAFGNLESSGIIETYDDIPLSMKKKAIAFMQAKQDPYDGYFYHSQWGKDINTSRRGRDHGNAVGIIRGFGAEPLYPTATERIAAAMSDGAAESADSTVPEHLRSKEAFISYLEGLGINESSYSIGHRIGQQRAEIRAAGLAHVCIDFLNSTQRENGFWEDTLSHSSSNGTMKISNTYNQFQVPFPRIMTAFKSALEVVLSDEPISAIVSIFNPPFTLLNFLEIMEREGDLDNLEKARKLLLENSERLIRLTAERLAVFKKPDGAFSYCPEFSSHGSQGKRVCLVGMPESDVNANMLANGSKNRTLKILGIPVQKHFDENDAKIFFELCGEASQNI